MSFRLSRVLTVGGCALAVAAVTMTSAFAATPTYTLKAGNAAPGTNVSLRASTGGTTPQITFVDTTSNTTLTCDSGTLQGTTKTGTNLPGAAIASINGSASTFTNCTGPFGLQFQVTGSGSWKINANSAAPGGVFGSVTGIRATVKDGSVCNFTAAGRLSGKFTNQYLTLLSKGTDPTLTISGVPSGQCFGVIKNGDTATFGAVYKIRSNKFSQNPITITQN